MEPQPENPSFACPHCGQGLEVAPDMAGGDFACPGCGKTLAVPARPGPVAGDDAPPDVKEADAFRSVKFVRRRRKHIEAVFFGVHLYMPDRLNGVGS